MHLFRIITILSGWFSEGKKTNKQTKKKTQGVAYVNTMHMQPYWKNAKSVHVQRAKTIAENRPDWTKPRSVYIGRKDYS